MISQTLSIMLNSYLVNPYTSPNIGQYHHTFFVEDFQLYFMNDFDDVLEHNEYMLPKIDSFSYRDSTNWNNIKLFTN